MTPVLMAILFEIPYITSFQNICYQRFYRCLYGKAIR